MNGARLVLSLLLVALPAMVLPAVRRTRRPQAWAVLLALSLGAGFVLFEAALIHAALPLGFTLLGLHELAAACRTLGGHFSGDPAPFSAVTAFLAVLVGVQGMRGATMTIRANSELRRSATRGRSTPIAGQLAVFLPLRNHWAVAIPGGGPHVVLSSALADTLERRELDAVVHHEMAHLEHHHVRFLLLGAAVTSGLWFLPWNRRAKEALHLALERWADEIASSRSREARARVRSALSKLASLAPSRLAGDRVRALESNANISREWGWPTVASATVPLAVALAATLVMHLSQVIALAGAG